MNNVTIYTTSVCPYCIAAKHLLKGKKIEYREIRLDADPQQREKLMKENGGWRTVPMVFFDGEFVGGYAELKEMNASGKLN